MKRNDTVKTASNRVGTIITPPGTPEKPNHALVYFPAQSTDVGVRAEDRLWILAGALEIIETSQVENKTP